MNGHDFTLEQNTEARMMLAVARRGLTAAINDAENGIGHLSCDDPKIMEQVRAHWRRLYDTYMNADHPKILERFAVRYGKYLKDNRTALDAAIIDPTGLVARHVATIKPKWD